MVWPRGMLGYVPCHPSSSRQLPPPTGFLSAPEHQQGNSILTCISPHSLPVRRGQAKLPKTKKVEEWSSSNQKLCVATTLPPLQVCLPVCFWWHTMDDSVQPLPLPAPPPPVPPPSAPPPSAIAEPLPTSIVTDTVKPIGSTVAERIVNPSCA